MFKAVLLLHALAGFFGLLLGPIAMYAKKTRGLHTKSGIVYFYFMTAVCISGVVLSALSWEKNWWLSIVALFSYSFCWRGFRAEKLRGQNWLKAHISGMLGSYIAMTTAFIVVNVGRIDSFQNMPIIVFWILPTLVGAPLIRMMTSKHASQAIDPE